MAPRLPLLGRHNVYNALAAPRPRLQSGVEPEAIDAELAQLAAVDKRGEVPRNRRRDGDQ